MEILSINMIHNIWLLMEFLTIEVLNSDSNFSALFDVESVSAMSNVRMSESQPS